MAKASKRRNPGMEKINKVLPKSIHQLGKKVESEYRQRFVLYRSPEIVGPGIAAHVFPVGIEGKKLLLYASAPAWRNEIMLMQLPILARFNTFAGYEMVQEMCFSWKRNTSYAPHKEKGSPAMEADGFEEQEASYKKAFAAACLTPEERGKGLSLLNEVEDGELKDKLLLLYEKKKRSDMARRALGEIPCPHCGRLVARDASCVFCRQSEKREKRRMIRRMLSDVPWLRYSEIREHIPCTPAMVASERSRLVQDMARRIAFGDWDSLEAKTLVMLYRSLPPDQLTPQIVRGTLYDLRRELSEAPVFRPFPKRAAVLRGEG